MEPLTLEELLHQEEDPDWDDPDLEDREEEEDDLIPPDPKRIAAGKLLMALGSVFLAASVIIWGRNIYQDRRAAEASKNMMPDIMSAIAQNVEAAEKQGPQDVEHVNPYDQEAMDKAAEMTVVVHNTWPYIGYLDLPSIRMKLPVLSEWSFHYLSQAPCRHMGSTKSDDLVICAHNYPAHFGKLKKMVQGDELTFTDMDGIRSYYKVATVEIVEPTDLSMIEDESLDLVLYTCTYTGQDRVMVGCQRIEKEESKLSQEDPVLKPWEVRK